MSPVACPHCWHVNTVPIGENAAVSPAWLLKSELRFSRLLVG